MPKMNELWAELRANPSSEAADGITMKLRVATSGVRLFAGFNKSNRLPELILEIPENAAPKGLARIGSRAFDVLVRPRSGLSAGRSAISLTLKTKEFEDLFGILGEDIVRAVESSQGEAAVVKAVVQCIERWRKFVERNRGRLSEEEVRGVIGELTVLARLINHTDAGAALNAWQGAGGLRDFELAGCAIEVKTHQAATGAMVRISDPAQLDPAPRRPLYLATIQLSRVENTGWTLAEAVKQLILLLVEDIESTGKLLDKLADQGYLTAHADMYPERYLVDRIHLFRIDDGFPRITSDSVPAGVEAVQFSIRLATIQRFNVQTDMILGSESTLEAAS